MLCEMQLKTEFSDLQISYTYIVSQKNIENKNV